MSMSHSEADRRLENVLQLGQVIDVSEENGTAQVKLGELSTPHIPWLAQKAAADHSWWPLEVGEWVLVAAPFGDMAQAVIIGAVPTGNHPPFGVPGTWRQSFADGSFIEFSNGNFRIHATGDVIITGANVRLN